VSQLVVITDSDLPSGGAEERLLAEAGLESRRSACRSEQDVIDRCAGADALIVQWAPISARVLDALPGVRMVSRLGIGYDMVDVEAATERGVAVANTPDYCIEEVACHTLALVLDQARGVVALDASVRAGRWSAAASFPAAARPSTTTVSVVGYGRIGARVAAALRAVGFQVLVHDRYVADRTVRDDGLVPVTLAEALAAADILTLHVPLTAETRHMIDARALERFKEGAILVNTSRGGLVDEVALVEALHARRLRAAALDVFAGEPRLAAGLAALPNVVLTPHVGGLSERSMATMTAQATEQVLTTLAGRPDPVCVANPQVLRHREAITP